MKERDVKKGADAIKKLNVWGYIFVIIYFILIISIALYFNFSRNDIRIYFLAIILLILIFGVYFLIYFKSKNPEIIKLRKNPELSKKVAREIEVEGNKRLLKSISINFWIEMILIVITLIFVIILFFWFRPHF